MKMSRVTSSKRGSLGISVQAIVILIIAVVIIGLIITFVKGAFGNLSKQLQEQISKEPDAPQPTTNKPITNSKAGGNIVAKAGKEEVIKVKILNTVKDPQTGAKTNVSNAYPYLTCDNDPTFFESIQVSPKNLDVGDIEDYTLIFTPSKSVVPKMHLCNIEAYSGNPDDHENSQKLKIKPEDVVLKIE